MLSVMRLPVKALVWRMFLRAMTLKTANSTEEASAKNEASKGFKEFSRVKLAILHGIRRPRARPGDDRRAAR